MHNQYEQCLVVTAKRMNIDVIVVRIQATCGEHIHDKMYSDLVHWYIITNALPRNLTLAPLWDSTAKMLHINQGTCCSLKKKEIHICQHLRLYYRAMKSGTATYTRDHSSDSSLAIKSSTISYFVHNHRYPHRTIRWIHSIPAPTSHPLTKHCPPEHSFKPSITKSTVKEGWQVQENTDLFTASCRRVSEKKP